MATPVNSPIKAVILDCFGVLYVPTSEYLYQSLLVNPSEHHDEIRDLVRQCDYGMISRETLYGSIARYTGRSLDDVRKFLSKDFTRNDALLDYVQSLRPLYKIGLLSNLGPNSMEQYFDRAQQAKLFDTVVVSSTVGMVKPNPEIFMYTCGKLGVDVSEAVMVDDVEENCIGAREAGLCAIQYESLQQATDALNKILIDVV